MPVNFRVLHFVVVKSTNNLKGVSGKIHHILIKHIILLQSVMTINNKRVYIKNINYNVTESDLSELLKPYNP